MFKDKTLKQNIQLSPLKWNILLWVKSQGGVVEIKQGYLAEELGASRERVCKAINFLESLGLITTSKIPGARFKEVRVTGGLNV